MRRFTSYLACFLLLCGTARASFPDNENALEEAFKKDSSPAGQAVLSYLYQYPTEIELLPPQKKAKELRAKLKELFETNWDTLDWSRFDVAESVSLLQATDRYRSSFKAQFPSYPFYPGDWYHVFHRRAQYSSGKRSPNPSEAAHWFLVTSCFEGQGEEVAAQILDDILRRPKMWPSVITNAQSTLDTLKKEKRTLCGDNAKAKTAAHEFRMFVALVGPDQMNAEFFEALLQAIDEAKLEKRKDLGQEFVSDVKKLKTDLQEMLSTTNAT